MIPTLTQRKRAQVRQIQGAFALAAAALCAGLLVGCGEDEATDENPADVLEAASDQTIERGAVELTLELGATAPDADFEIRMSLEASGVFRHGESALPEFDLAVDIAQSADEQDFSFRGGATAVAGAGYIAANDQSYELNDAVVKQLQDVDLDRLDPGGWVLEPSNEGREEIDGADTIHISGSANVERIFGELQAVAAQAGIEAGSLEGASAGDFTETTADVYVVADDRVLRRVELRFEWEGKLEGGEDLEGTADVTATFAELNEDLEIDTPEDPQPFSEFAAHAPRELSGLVEFLGGRRR